MELLIWYGICVVIVTCMTILSVKKNFSNKTVFYIMAAVSFLSEACKILTHMDEVIVDGKSFGYFIAPGSLPFHLCSILIFLFFYFVLSNNEEKKNKLLEFVVPVGLLGGLMGDLFATSGTKFTEPYAYQCFIYHSYIIWFSLHFMITRKVKLGKQTLKNNLITLFIVMICALWVNGILRSHVLTDGRYINFMFLAQPPMKNLPFLNLNHGWYVYFIHLLITGVILVSAVHLPFIVMEKKAELAIEKKVSVELEKETL